jgi:RNase P subunit RPR2
MIRGHIYCNKCDMWYKPLEKIIRTITNNEGIKINVGYLIMICPDCGHIILPLEGLPIEYNPYYLKNI